MIPLRTILVASLTASLLPAAPVGPLESLVQDSPFLPPGYRSSPAAPTPQPERAPPAASRFALTGVTTHDGVLRISLRPQGQRRGRWLRTGESWEGENLRFLRFDEDAMVAVVETVNGTEVIPLKKPRVIPIPPASSPNPPGTFPVPPNAGGDRPDPGQPAERPNVPVRRRVIQPAQG